MKLNILWAIPCTVQKKKKKNEKIKNDDLDLFYEYFSSIMSCEYPFIEKKTGQNSPKKIFLDIFIRSLDSRVFWRGQVCLAS